MLQLPCGILRRLSCGCAVLRGRQHIGLGRVWVAPLLRGVHRPTGLQSTYLPAAEASGALRGLPLHFRVHHREPVPSRRLPGWSDDTSSPGLPCPSTQSRLVDTCLGGGSLRRPAPRARFGYLLRGSYHQPSRRLRAGASMGFTLQGVPFAAIGAPLGAHALLPLPAAAASLRGVPPGNAACFRALFLRRIRSVTDTLRCRPPIPSWGSTLQSVLPSDLALALVAAPPLSPLGGLTSRPAWASGCCGNEWVGQSVSGSPTLLGFSTFRRSQRSVHRSAGRAYSFASRLPPRMW
jgi:hypothetical protein